MLSTLPQAPVVPVTTGATIVTRSGNSSRSVQKVPAMLLALVVLCQSVSRVKIPVQGASESPAGEMQERLWRLECRGMVRDCRNQDRKEIGDHIALVIVCSLIIYPASPMASASVTPDLRVPSALISAQLYTRREAV